MIEKILIIEDESGLRANVEQILQFEGFETLTAKNGSEGIKLAVHKLPDLILCDIAMSGLTGYEVIQYLNSNSRTKNIPFIFMTAKAELKDIRKGMELGAVDYLTKPFTRDDLINSVQTRLKKKNEEEERILDLRNSIRQSFPHEFRTPLSAIIGYADLLKHFSYSFSSDEIVEYADGIIENAGWLKQVSDRFLFSVNLDLMTAYDRVIDPEKREVLPYPSAIIFDSLASLSRKHSLLKEVISDICEDKIVNIPEEFFDRIIAEVFDNAMKFSDGIGDISIITSISEGFYKIQVKNPVQIITSEQVAKIDEFIQFNRLKIEKSGLGLGLSIVKKVVFLVDGKISIGLVDSFFTVEILLPILEDYE